MSMTKPAEIIQRQLKEPFDYKEVKWRVAQAFSTQKGKSAKILAYIDARLVQDRLDEVMGINNWAASFRHEGSSPICKLSLRIEGEWITKEDGAPESDIEGFKGGISDSFKRAAVHFGIGRYLYGLGDFYVPLEATKPAGVKCGFHKDREERKNYYFVYPAIK